ncbi:hypothetical protein [Nocardia sp. CA-145437]|uniref:hypothetical protein n=1 Tax=Nocardia sp. CA-145437 TaxID=3239980 RepID=UPI003D95C286
MIDTNPGRGHQPARVVMVVTMPHEDPANPESSPFGKRWPAACGEPGPDRAEEHQLPVLVVGGDEQGSEHLAAGVAGQPADDDRFGRAPQREFRQA